MRSAQGFTIIELMIVVTIVGILVAIGIPSYQSYANRAKITEGVLLAGPAKVAVYDYLVKSGRLPVDNAEAGIDAPAQLRGRYVRSTEVVDGVITVTFGDPALDGETITLTPSSAESDMTWVCTSSLPDHLKPKGCA
jgi:type IV pilus assembly protein PilA